MRRNPHLLPPPFRLNCRPERRECDAELFRATCPQRIGRRLDFRETGHFVQASTSRSPFAGRCLRRPLDGRPYPVRKNTLALHRRKRAPIVATPWKWLVSTDSSGMCDNRCTIQQLLCNVSPRIAVHERRPILSPPPGPRCPYRPAERLTAPFLSSLSPVPTDLTPDTDPRK